MSRAAGLRSILDRIYAWMHAWKCTLTNLIVLGLIGLTNFVFGFGFGWWFWLPYFPIFLFMCIAVIYASMKYDVEGVWLTPRAQLLYLLVAISLLLTASTWVKYGFDATFTAAFVEACAQVLPPSLPLLFLLIYRDVKKGPPSWRLRLAGVAAYLILLSLSLPLMKFPFTSIIFAPTYIFIILVLTKRWPLKRAPLKEAEDASKA